jgi:hypothetical protein
MSFVIDAPTISVVVASASVIIGAIYYMLESRHQRITRQTENIIRLSPWFNMNAKEIQETINSVCSVKYTNTEEYFEKYSDKPEQTSLKMLGNYLEGVGVLVSRGLVETGLIYDFWGDIAMSTWEDNEKIIYAMRERASEPRMFEYWEKLAGEMRRRKEIAGIIKPRVSKV